MAYTNIDDPSAHFQTALWAGNSSTQTITNDGNSDLQPDWVWLKSRTTTNVHLSQDSTIGATGGVYRYLQPDNTAAEAVQTDGDGITSLNSDGFSLGYGNSNSWNSTGKNYVAWQWKANGGTTSSNTDGTGITSTVQANTDAGFSIVTYTGIGSGNANPSVGHGLGVTPQVVLVKGRSQANSWIMYHYGIDGANSRNKYLILNTNGAAGTLANYWGTAASGGVTSSTFGVYADNQSGNNYLNGTHVAYCFAEKQGYSKFGSYVGNGNANGTFVYTGFKPAWVMTKETGAAGSWVIYDNKRDAFNPETKLLSAEASSAEATFTQYDFVSNGFKFRTSGSENSSGNKHIYMAFAENPFTTSTGIPTTAR